MDNANYFRAKLTEAGFDLKPSESAICALMLYDAVLSQQFAAELQKENIYVTGFYYPVVPKGQARIRIQLSAAHTREQLDRALAAFIKIGKNWALSNKEDNTDTIQNSLGLISNCFFFPPSPHFLIFRHHGKHLHFKLRLFVTIKIKNINQTL